MQFTILSHAGLLVEHAGTRVVLHSDHFQEPSLRKFLSRETTMLVPRIPPRRMVEDLNYLGFRSVSEIPHGALDLAGDFSLRSCQFGLEIDSGAAFAGGGVRPFDCNDVKFFGLQLRKPLDVATLYPVKAA